MAIALLVPLQLSNDLVSPLKLLGSSVMAFAMGGGWAGSATGCSIACVTVGASDDTNAASAPSSMQVALACVVGLVCVVSILAALACATVAESVLSMMLPLVITLSIFNFV